MANSVCVPSELFRKGKTRTSVMDLNFNCKEQNIMKKKKKKTL